MLWPRAFCCVIRRCSAAAAFDGHFTWAFAPATRATSTATIGMAATVLNGADDGEGAMVAANALVLEGFEIPPGTLAAGVPAKVRRDLTEADIDRFRQNAEGYVERSRLYLKGAG